MKAANEDKEAPNDEQIAAEIASKLKEVESLLSKKMTKQALSLSLRNPPAGNRSESIKDASAAIVERVLLSFQDSEISEAIEQLDLDACDILMKYVFKFMGRAQNCALMLKLHALITEKAGPGSIMRALTDRKLV